MAFPKSAGLEDCAGVPRPMGASALAWTSPRSARFTGISWHSHLGEFRFGGFKALSFGLREPKPSSHRHNWLGL